VSGWDDQVAGADAVSVAWGVLLVRAVCRPSDVHRLTQEIFNAGSGRYLSEELAPYRAEAEASLRAEAETAGVSPEAVPLAAIYAKVGELLVLDPATTAALLEAELAAERQLLRADPRQRERYRAAVAAGTPVVVVADTGLPRPFLAEVLEAQGFPAPQGLVVSSHPGRPGADAVWDELLGPAPGRTLIHVGPAQSVGPPRPRVTGAVAVTGPVDAYRLQHGPAVALDGPRVFAHLDIDGYRLKNLHRSLLNAQVATGLSVEPAPSARQAVGYGALGPFLLAVVQWVHRAAVGRGCSSLLFDPADGRFVADAYCAWWGPEALPVGWTGESGGGDGRAGSVTSGWNAGSERWDGTAPTPVGPTEAAGPVVLAVAVDPSAAEEESGTVVMEAFVGGRLTGQQALFDDVFAADRGFLSAWLGGVEPTGAPSGALDDLRRSAVRFVSDFRALTSGMPSTVAIVDDRTACENLVMVLNFPQPDAAGVLELGAPQATG